MVYLAEHPALALVEVLVHLEVDAEDLPSGYQLLEVNVPADVTVTNLTERDLDETAPGWRTDATLSRAAGQAWRAQRASALLRVPSVIVPHAFNLVLDPRHTDAARIGVVSSTRMEFDARLFKER